MHPVKGLGLGSVFETRLIKVLQIYVEVGGDSAGNGVNKSPPPINKVRIRRKLFGAEASDVTRVMIKLN